MFDWFHKNKSKFENEYSEEQFKSQSVEMPFHHQAKKQSNFRFPLIPDDYDEEVSGRQADYSYDQSGYVPNLGEIAQEPVMRQRRPHRNMTGAPGGADFSMSPKCASEPPVRKRTAYLDEQLSEDRVQQERNPWEIPNTPPLFRTSTSDLDLDKRPTFLRKTNQKMPPSPFQNDLQYVDAKPRKTEKDLHIFDEKKQSEPRKFFRPTPFVSPVHGRLETPDAPREKRKAYEKSIEKLYGFSNHQEEKTDLSNESTDMPMIPMHSHVEKTHAVPPEGIITKPFDAADARKEEVGATMVATPFISDTLSDQAVSPMGVASEAAFFEKEVEREPMPTEEVCVQVASVQSEAEFDTQASEPSFAHTQVAPLDEKMMGQSQLTPEFKQLDSTTQMDSVKVQADSEKENELYVQAVDKKADAYVHKEKPRRTERTVPVNAMMFNEDKMYLRKKQLGIEPKQMDMYMPQKQVEPTDAKQFAAKQADTGNHMQSVEQQEQREMQVCAYQFPPLELLKQMSYPDEQVDYSTDSKVQVLDQVLKDFNVGGKVVSMTKGPTVTRYEVQPDPGVKVNKIVNLADDLKLYLAAQDIRIEAPIPGKSMVGIEIPNDHPRPVFLREILEHPDFATKPSATKVALGLNIEGMPVSTDIRKMPHGLIAGSTGSGKSVCINSILISLLYQAHPDEVKLMLIDPKMVELASYNALPHLVCPVITNAKAATKALKWAVDEMERRYELFSKIGVRDINRYNELASREEHGVKMATIVIIIDELADLMMVAANEVESHICRIAQKARACGIHLILATQRPSVDVITGLIKANIPSRIAFSVSSQIDSRTILDSNGAERLLGKGDMLLSENGSSKLVRVQGTYVSDDEIEEVVAFVKKQMAPQYLFTAEEMVIQASDEEEDELFQEILAFAIETGTISTSMIQRKFRIGYNRASRIIDALEEKGYISGANGSKPREVLVEQLE